MRVAVIDSGWDPAQRNARVLPGWGFCHEAAPFRPALTADARDFLGHGTACARIILDLSPGAHIIPLRVFVGSLETSPPVLCAALRWSLEHRVDVINLSLATSEVTAVPSLYRACADLHAAGIVVVAAADNQTGGGYPAEFADVIGVTLDVRDGVVDPTPAEPVAMDVRLDRAAAAHLRSVLTAAGRHPGSVRMRNSFAAAYVSGVASDLISRHGRMPMHDLRTLLSERLAAVA